MPSTLIIYNPVAGRMRVRALWPKIELALKDAGVDFDAVATTGPLAAIHFAQSAVGRYAKVVAVGGDGTVSEVVNGLMQASREGQSLPLAIIPLGNGDDFAKVLPPQAAIGGACYDWRAAIDKIVRGQSQLYDVGRLCGDQTQTNTEHRYRYFLNVVDVGFGAHTVQNFASVPKFISGNTAYFAAVFKTMINYPALRLRIQLDDAPAVEHTTTITAIGNGRCFGGGFWVCPDAIADDGLFDVMIGQEVTRWKILQLLPKLQRGTHTTEPVVKMSRARRVVLESDAPFLVEADGEMPLSPTRRLEIDLLPRRLRLVV